MSAERILIPLALLNLAILVFEIFFDQKDQEGAGPERLPTDPTSAAAPGG